MAGTSVSRLHGARASGPAVRKFVAPQIEPDREPEHTVRPPAKPHWSAVGVLGEIAITLGVVVLLFGIWDLWGTGLVTDQAQAQLSKDLDTVWSHTPYGPIGPLAAGTPLMKLHIPTFGDGWTRTVLEGVDQDVLASGPGHYPGTALPGTVGNVALAGHRVSHAAPFDQAGELRSCDALVLETGEAWYVYRVLPTEPEAATWTATAANRPECRGIKVLGGPYAKTFGVEIVSPKAYDVVAPIPHETGAAATGSLLTLTTCNPRFSSRQRLVIHAVLTAQYPKSANPAGWTPPDLGS